MTTTVTEDDVEQLALDWLSEVDWQTVNGAEIAPDTLSAERDDFGVVILERRLRNPLERLNPNIGHAALDDAYRKLMSPQGTSLVVKNESLSPDVGRGRNCRISRQR